MEVMKIFHEPAGHFSTYKSHPKQKTIFCKLLPLSLLIRKNADFAGFFMQRSLTLPIFYTLRLSNIITIRSIVA